MIVFDVHHNGSGPIASVRCDLRCAGKHRTPKCAALCHNRHGHHAVCDRFHAAAPFRTHPSHFVHWHVGRIVGVDHAVCVHGGNLAHSAAKHAHQYLRHGRMRWRNASAACHFAGERFAFSCLISNYTFESSESAPFDGLLCAFIS